MNEVVIKSKETKTGVQFRVLKDNQYIFMHVDFQNYYYIKTIDFDAYEDEFYKQFKWCISKTETISQFTKIYLDSNWMRNKTRNFWEERCHTFEADILANKRFLLDKKIILNNTKIPYTFYDIETDDRKPLRQDDRGLIMPQSRILSFSAVNHKGEKIYFELNSDTDEDEKALLIMIIDYFSKYGIVSGWNSIRFDMPYIKGRCDTFGIDYTILNYVNHLDYMELFKKYDKKSRPSFSLNAISNEVLNESKIDQDKGNGAIWNTWLNDKEQLKKYNIEDSNLIYKINKKRMFIEVSMKRADNALCHVQSTVHNSDSGDYLLMREYKKNDIIMPSQPTKEDTIERLKAGKIGGGYTTCFKPGFHENVYIWDFKSEYPSVIQTWNISPETYIETIHNESDAKLIDRNKFIVTPSDFEKEVYHPARIYKKEEGVIPKVVKKLVEERDKIKYTMKEFKISDPDKYKQMYLEQYALKTDSNCFHPNTMVLTKNGIKNIKDLQLNEKVLSINPKTLETEYKKIIALHNENFKGDLIKFENKRTLLRTTPNHKFLLWDKLTKDNIFLPIKNVIKQRHQIPVAKFDNDFSTYLNKTDLNNKIYYDKDNQKHLENFNTKALSELIGWFISEGSLSKQSYLIKITQYKKKNLPLIKKTLEDLNLKFYQIKSGFRFNSRFYYDFLKKNFGDNSYQKKCPIKFLDILDNLSLFKTLDLGDGTKSQGRYTTKSKQLAEDLLHLFNKIGYKTRLKLDKSKSWRLYFNKATLGEKHSLSKQLSKEYYEGKVYNLTIEAHHTLMAAEYKDNGNLGFVWTSQSIYGILAFPMSRYYSWELGDSVTTCARATLKACNKKVEEWGCEVIGGDTDSSFIKLGKDNTTEEINDKYITFLHYWKNKYGCEKNKLIFEYEKKFDKMLFVGKKNYAYIIEEEISIVGLAAIKSDSNPFAAKLQKEFITDILKGTYDELGWATKVEDIYNKVFNQELTTAELLLVKAISKMPADYVGPTIDSSTGQPKVKADGTIQMKSILAHVKLAARLISQGKDIYPGSKIKFIVVKDKPILALSQEEYERGFGSFEYKHKKLGIIDYEWGGGYDALYYWLRIMKPLITAVYTYHKILPDWEFNLSSSQLRKLMSKMEVDE